MLKKDPFFIFYDARSGSTFLANQLIKYADTAIPPESNLIALIVKRYPKHLIKNTNDLDHILRILGSDEKFEDWAMETGYIRKQLEQNFPIPVRDCILLICELYRKNNFPEATCFGFKKGSYINCHRQLKELFPRAKFIGLIRDGRAVFNSKKNSITSTMGEPFEVDPRRAARLWCRTVGMLKAIKDKYPEETLLIHYEDLIENYKHTMEKIALHLNVNFNTSRTVPENGYQITERYKHLHKYVHVDPRLSRISAWKSSLADDEIAAYEAVASKTLASQGYELCFPRSSAGTIHKRFISGLKAFIAQ